MDLKSILGYSQGSPYANNPYLDIHTPNGYIDMSKTPVDLMGVDNQGNKQMMKAGAKNPYKFDGDVVREIPMQRGGSAYGFLFGDDNDEEDTPPPMEEPTAPSAEEVTPVATNDYDMSLQMAMSIGTDPFTTRRVPQSLPHGVADAEVMSSGRYGSENIGEYGKQIYQHLSSDLGYNPVANSIFRDANQQNELVKKGLGVKNSWHLTGNAIDLKPRDWNNLSRSQQSFYRNNYDVVYHNNHYHIEPRQ